MAKKSGRNAAVFFDVAGGGSASLLPGINKYTLDSSTEQLDVTSFEDTTKTYVADIPDASGTFSGFWDDATEQTYTAAVDGLPRKFYLYPDKRNLATTYWFGTIYADFSIDGGLGQAVNVSATWKAATPIQKVHA